MSWPRRHGFSLSYTIRWRYGRPPYYILDTGLDLHLLRCSVSGEMAVPERRWVSLEGAWCLHSTGSGGNIYSCAYFAAQSPRCCWPSTLGSRRVVIPRMRVADERSSSRVVDRAADFERPHLGRASLCDPRRWSEPQRAELPWCAAVCA